MTTIVNHIGITVSDIERSLAFYRLFGAEVIGEIEHAGPVAERGTGVEGIDGICTLLHVGSQVIELLAFDHPPPRDFGRNSAEVGVAHLAFEFEDLEAAFDRLSAEGVVFESPPISIEEGAFAGGKWCYCTDPDGIPVELTQPGPGFRRVLDEIRGSGSAPS
jgi:catechol 2,3-dioxygenase-like lactoylglutathione lyase family enzyme